MVDLRDAMPSLELPVIFVSPTGRFLTLIALTQLIRLYRYNQQQKALQATSATAPVPAKVEGST
jgi:hypothetical protein